MKKSKSPFATATKNGIVQKYHLFILLLERAAAKMPLLMMLRTECLGPKLGPHSEYILENVLFSLCKDTIRQTEY